MVSNFALSNLEHKIKFRVLIYIIIIIRHITAGFSIVAFR